VTAPVLACAEYANFIILHESLRTPGGIPLRADARVQTADA